MGIKTSRIPFDEELLPVQARNSWRRKLLSYLGISALSPCGQQIVQGGLKSLEPFMYDRYRCVTDTGNAFWLSGLIPCPQEPFLDVKLLNEVTDGFKSPKVRTYFL